MSDAAEKARATAVVMALATLGNAVHIYDNGAEAIAVTGYIEQEGEPFGGEVTVSDLHFIATLLVDEVGQPKRGDTITDEASKVWILREERPNDDPWTTDWVVQPQ